MVKNDFHITQEKILENFARVETDLRRKKAEILEKLEISKHEKLLKLKSRKSLISGVIEEISEARK